jgi:hypothetical protein
MEQRSGGIKARAVARIGLIRKQRRAQPTARNGTKTTQGGAWTGPPPLAREDVAEKYPGAKRVVKKLLRLDRRAAKPLRGGLTEATNAGIPVSRMYRKAAAMTMACPPMARTLVISDDPQLAAQMSCAVALPGHYLPVVEGPRFLHPDPAAELVRRNNAAGRVRPESIFMTGLSDRAFDALTARFAVPLKPLIRRVSMAEEIDRLVDPVRFAKPPLTWGRDRIGIGLLKALREKRSIVFADDLSPIEAVPAKSGHLVVCEQGEPLAEVIAANYAYALRAGLCLIPDISRELSEELLEDFYSLYDNRFVSPNEALRNLRDRLCALTGKLPVTEGGSITFITGGLPMGFSVPEVPSTHLFKYPDLGIAMINGFAAEQPGRPGIGFVALIDPETTEAAEIAAAERLLPPRGAFVRSYCGSVANVRDVTAMMGLLPYDMMIIATHCGDVDGFRWTYKFTDSEGIDRTLVVDIAIGVGQTSDANLLNVTQFIRFVSLDGIDWHDPEKKRALYVGKAIFDYLEQTRSSTNPVKPVKKETVPRVVGSSALKMYDHNLIVLPRPLADESTPIIINNACASWRQLASNFFVGGARAYVGTLFPVTASEAQQVVIKLLEKHAGKPLPGALWSAQREVYNDDVRRPYIATGIYPQRLRIKRQDVIGHMVRRLSAALAGCTTTLASVDPNDSDKLRTVQESIAFYERELAHFQELARK